MSRPFRTRVIEVPKHLLGGPFMVQTVNLETHHVVATVSGIRTFERAVNYAYEHREWFHSVIVYDHEALPLPARKAGVL